VTTQKKRNASGRPSYPHLVETEQPIEADHEHNGHHEQDHRHSDEGEAPVEQIHDLCLDHHGERDDREPPTQSGDDEQAQGLDETRRPPRRHPAG